MTVPAEDFEIPRTVESLEAVDQPALRPFYKPGDDGRFHLRLRENEPDVARKLEEFRTNNRSLNARKAEVEAQNAELEAKLKNYEGIDPAEYQALKAKLQELEGKVGATDAATAKAAELEALVAQEKVAREAAQLRAAIGFPALAAGAEKGATEFLIQRAASAFTVNDKGELVATMFSPDKPGVKMSVDEWLRVQQREVPFAFRPSKGAGSHNGGGTPSAPAKPVVNRDDALEFGRNLERIAKGDAIVR